MTEKTDNIIIPGPGNSEFEFVRPDEAEDLEKVEYLSSTGVPRFDFQRGACRNSDGIILNVGCNEDPAMLKALFGGRCFNCDLQAYDETMGRNNLVDHVFDMTDTWPFADESAELVVFGDCLEHLPPHEIEAALKEAARVARRVCITVPEDHRIEGDPGYDKGAYNGHITVVTEDILRRALKNAGWTPFVFLKAGWGFDDVEGWCVEAHRTV